MVVPLLLGGALHTFAPHAGEFFGSFTQALTVGAIPILGAWLFCMGTSIDIRESPVVLKKSGVLLITKVLVAGIAGYFFSKILPFDGIKQGFFAGLSTMAIIAAMNETNNGLYAGLMAQYGDREERAAFCLTSIEAGPFLTMLTLGIIGVASFPWQTFVGALIPFGAGLLLGNLDKDIKAFFAPLIHPLIPFFAFGLGNTLDFSVMEKTGVLGLLLGIFVIVVTGIPLLLADRFISKGSGTAGIAAASTAGSAVPVPAAIASIAPQFASSAPAATALIATSVVVSAIVVPFLAFWWHRYSQRNSGA